MERMYSILKQKKKKHWSTFPYNLQNLTNVYHGWHFDSSWSFHSVGNLAKQKKTIQVQPRRTCKLQERRTRRLLHSIQTAILDFLSPFSLTSWRFLLKSRKRDYEMTRDKMFWIFWPQQPKTTILVVFLILIN